MNSTFRRQLAASREELSQTGLPRRRREPLTYRTLWALGFQLRPPHYAQFRELLQHDLITLGCYGIALWLIALLDSPGVALFYVALTALVIALISSVIRLIYYRRLANRYSLSTWEALGSRR